MAELSIRVTLASPETVGSPIRISQVQLYGPNLEELDCRSVSAILFWRSIMPNESNGDRRIDLYTQKGGVGQGNPGGWFGFGDVVNLKANVTYADWPQQNLLVAFQAIDPLNNTAMILVTETDENGFAETSFKLPEVSESVGLWTVVSSVDIACEVVWDTLTFLVSSQVGGETTVIERYHGHYIYFAVVGILVLGLAASKRVFRGSSEHSFPVSSRLSNVHAQKLLHAYADYEWGIT
jgi:hypothetical protein